MRRSGSVLLWAVLLGHPALAAGLHYGDRFCLTEQAFDAWERARHLGPTPPECHMAEWPLRAELLRRMGPGKTEIRLRQGEFAGRRAWTGAGLEGAGR